MRPQAQAREEAPGQEESPRQDLGAAPAGTPRPGPEQEPAGRLTILSGLLHEGLHAAFAIAALRGQRGHVVPLEGAHDVHHGLGLVRV